jgi:hypothetical protein
MATAETREPMRGLTFEDVWAALMELRESQKETDRQLKAQAEAREREMKAQAEARDRELKVQAEAREREMKAQAEAHEWKMKEDAEKFDRKMKEDAEAHERKMKEDAEKFDREMKARKEEHEREWKELRRQLKETDRIVGNLGNKFGKLAEHLIVPNMLKKFNALGFTFIKAGRNLELMDAANERTLAEADVFLENDETVMIVEIKADPTIEDVQDHIRRMEVVKSHADDRKDRRTFMGAVAGAMMDEQVKQYILNTGFYAITQSGDTVKIEEPEKPKRRTW